MEIPHIQDGGESRELGPNTFPLLPPLLLDNAKSQVLKQVLEEFIPIPIEKRKDQDRKSSS